MSEDTKLVLSVLRKTFGVGAAVLMSEVEQAHDNAIATGNLAIDYGLLGVGGYPRGQFLELYARDKVGKTSLVLLMIASAQREGIVPIVIDPKASTANDIARASRIGVVTEDVVLLPVQTSEEALVQARQAIKDIRAENIDLAFFWDDMSISPTHSNVDPKKPKKKGEKVTAPVAEKAKVMWDFCRSLAALCYRERVSMVIVNHMIAQISTGFSFAGPRETTSGGGATRAAARIRVHLKRLSFIKTKSVKTGHVVKAITEANAFFKPQCSVLLALDYVNGYDPKLSLLYTAEDAGFVTKARGKYRAKHWPKGHLAKLAIDWNGEELAELAAVMWPQARVSGVELPECVDVDDEDEVFEDDEDEAEIFMDSLDL
jgi:recombination protein RecA